MDGEKLIQFDPKKLQVIPEENPRYGAPADIQPLKDSIMSEGGVNVPIEVEALDPAVNGFTHKVLVGFRRHAAVMELNKEGAGLTLPGIVRQRADQLARLKTQISENRDRKSLSPMDTAVALKKLLDAGMSKIEVRAMFPRPTTGKKKGQIENAPASNAWVNMTLSFLELPKDIREKIHDGRIGVKAAYELTRVSPEKRAAVLAKAEAELSNDLAREEADEKKFIASQAKIEEAEKAETETVIKMDTAKAEVELRAKAVEEAQKKAAELFQKSMTVKDKDAKKKAVEAFKAAEADAKGLEKTLVSAQKDVDKLEAAKKKFADTASEGRKKLEEARKNASKPKKGAGGGVSSTAVKKAAAEAGEGHVQLTAADMRKFIHDLSLAEKPYPKVAEIGRIIHEHFQGGPTDGQTIKKLATFTGELKGK